MRGRGSLWSPWGLGEFFTCLRYKVSRQFSLWLLTRIDVDKRTLLLTEGVEIDLCAENVQKVFGIPCGRRPVDPMSPMDHDDFVELCLGAKNGSADGLKEATNIVQQPICEDVRPGDEHTFKSAFIGATTETGEIEDFNWGDYVVKHVIAAAKKVQAERKNGIPVSTVTGCPLLVQIMYLDCMDFGALNNDHSKVPRVRDFKCDNMRLMIELDSASCSSGGGDRSFGSSKLRPFHSIAYKLLVCYQKPTFGVPEIQEEKHARVYHSTAVTQSSATPDFFAFLRAKYPNQLTTPDVEDLKLHNARCLQHFHIMKCGIIKENMALAEKLLSRCSEQDLIKPTRNPMREDFLSDPDSGAEDNAQWRNCSRPMQHSQLVGSRLGNQQRFTQHNNRSYSRRAPSYQNKKSARCPKAKHQIETILSGPEGFSHDANPTAGINTTWPNLPPELFAPIPKSGAGKSLEASHDEFPSFDLGVDFSPGVSIKDRATSSTNGSSSHRDVLTEKADVVTMQGNEQSKGMSSISHDNGNQKYSSDYEAAVLNTDKIHPPNVHGTPTIAVQQSPKPAEKNSSSVEDNNVFRTPQQFQIKSASPTKYSPNSWHKIFATSALFDRLVESEDKINLNEAVVIEADSLPAKKKIKCEGRKNFARSPWALGLKFKKTDEELSNTQFQLLSTTSGSELQRARIMHQSSRFIEIDGESMKNFFCAQKQMNFDLFDVSIRRLLQLDALMYPSNIDIRWRHMLESDFVMLALAGEDPTCNLTIKSQFLGPGVTYDLSRCRMFYIPFMTSEAWCCYVWDMKAKKVHIIDPRVGKLGVKHILEYHAKTIKDLHKAFGNCLLTFFDGWKLEWGELVPVVPFSSHLNSTREESGFYTLFSIIQFNGERFVEEPTKEKIDSFKKTLLYELLGLEGNMVKPPSVYVHTIDD
ncbi:hypothetical protein ACP70R_032733 [Stipagrostis hirtigluma subsp. patula]